VHDIARLAAERIPADGVAQSRWTVHRAATGLISGCAELLLRRVRFARACRAGVTSADAARLLRAVLAASTAPQPGIVKQIREAPPEQISATPEHAATLLEMLDWHVQAHRAPTLPFAAKPQRKK
jgi:hypothetical protein